MLRWEISRLVNRNPDRAGRFVLVCATRCLLPILGFHFIRRVANSGGTHPRYCARLDVALRERAERNRSQVVRECGGARIHRFLESAQLHLLAGADAGASHHRIDSEQQFVVFILFQSYTMCLVRSAPFSCPFIPENSHWFKRYREKLWNSPRAMAGEATGARSARFRGFMSISRDRAALACSGELFHALPQAFRQQFAELPATFSASTLCGGSASVLDVFAALAPLGSSDAAYLKCGALAAAGRLAECRAMENCDLDLLRCTPVPRLAPLLRLLVRRVC